MALKFCPTKITQNVRDYAAQQNSEENREQGLKQMQEEFQKQGSSLYQKV